MKIENLEKIIFAINEMLKRLNNLRRWTNFVTNAKYDEISKQALNCNICYVLATEAERNGVSIKWNRFPKIAIYRAFQKAYVNYDTPEYILREICELGNISFDKVFGEVTLEIIAELTNETFASWISEGSGTVEETIYKAATSIATLLEMKEIQMYINGKFESEYDRAIKRLTKYEDIPGFHKMADEDSGCFKFFKSVSNLRNRNRWAAYSYIVNCSVLGHLFDTGIFSYVIALEKGETEDIATKCFFMGIFHDVPETFTTDIPAPIKDKISGFRELTEKYEMLMMEKYVYSIVPKEVADSIKKVMFEDSENSDFKRTIKGADYMSATSEICRELEAARGDEAFFNALKIDLQSRKMSEDSEIVNLGPEIRKALKQMFKFADEIKRN